MKNMRRASRLAVLGCAALALTAEAGERAAVERRPYRGGEGRKVMNIVNFVRACEPRSNVDLVKPLAEEIWFNTHYGLKNTILLQYDALLDERLMRTAFSADRAKTEYGVWFEVVKPLCDKVGLPWRGRKGWNWDWHVVPGFPMAYTPKEREALTDELMRLATEKLGKCPESVGSWILDAHTMDYMSRKYGVKAFCICREQDNTDAYGLRGGYFNGAYYPSKVNMLSAARDMKNAIRTPVFKMLTPDPIYNYSWSNKMFDDFTFGGCATMEPVWYTGFTPATIDWFFRIYAEPKGMLNLSYMQTGQENSFGWPMISLGLPYQMKAIAQAAKTKGLIVETLGETGRRFIADHAANCAQTQVALEDWTGKGRKSVWYNSRCYRANLLIDKGVLAFRDIHQMCDDYREPHFDTACPTWKLEYFTPPVVDTYLDREKEKGIRGDLAFEGTFARLDVATPDSATLVVTATRTDGSVARITCTETKVRVEGSALAWAVREARRGEIAFAPGRIDLTFRGYRHSVGLKGTAAKTATGWRLAPANGAIEFEL